MIDSASGTTNISCFSRDNLLTTAQKTLHGNHLHPCGQNLS
jgi:hypothetical protein